jgi:predicted nucleotidyltransferase
VEPFDPEPYRKEWKKRSDWADRQNEERFAEAMEFLPKLVASFREIDPDLDKIILFGSLAKGKPKRADFDIDVAVRSDRYFRMVAWALDQVWKIDVVDLDAIGNTILSHIESEGRTLYEKDRL